MKRDEKKIIRKIQVRNRMNARKMQIKYTNLDDVGSSQKKNTLTHTRHH